MNTSETSQSIHEQIVTLLPRLRRFARNLTRNPHDADDVVQIAVERALTRLDQWQSGARLDSWVFKIVRNAWIDELRARGRRDKVFLAAEEGDNIGTDSMARETELLSVQSAMARLPEDQRERYKEEWQSHIDEIPGDICKIVIAVGFVPASKMMSSEMANKRPRIVNAEAI